MKKSIFFLFTAFSAFATDALSTNMVAEGLNSENSTTVSQDFFYSNPDKDTANKTKAVEERPQISMTTARGIGEYVGFSIKGEDDIEIIGAEYDSPGYFVITDQNIIIKGNITKIDCCSNQLTMLDVSKQPNLTELYCDDNKLEKLILGNQPNLVTLYIGNNKLESVDLTQLPVLEDFSCFLNNLTTLDLSKNPMLTSLICRDNQITGTLDFSGNKKLNQVNCYNNKITSIKLAPDTEMRHMEIQRNNINGKNMTDFMEALPAYQAFPPGEWDDWYGLNLQGIYVTEKDRTLENNIALTSDVKIAKDKGWPVYEMSIDDYGITAPTEYEGEQSTGINDVNTNNESSVLSYDGNTLTVRGLTAADIVNIYDASGRQVMKTTVGKEELSIDMSRMPQGIYVARCKTAKLKFMVK